MNPHQSQTVPDPESPLREPGEPVVPEAVVGDADDRLIKGHTYDGIREYDNPMPGWWTWLFVATVAWAPVYVLGVHAFDFIDTYEEDLAEARAELAEVREVYAATGPAFKTDAGALREYAGDAAMAEAGVAHFTALCAACHGAQGEGGIGPNLVDAYWLHGASPEDIYRVISEGVVTNGMPAWEGALSEEERAQVMAHVFSIRGTNPPGAKPPQGERVE